MTVTDRPSSRWWQRRWWRAVVVAVALGAWPACNRHAEDIDDHVPAPLDFVLKDVHGQDVGLADFRGKPVVVNFWATWCGPCKTEVPWFVEFAEKYKDQNLIILGVSVDDPVDDIRTFAEQYDVNYPMLVGLGHDDVAKAYDALLAIPVTWLIRPDGTVLAKVTGIHGKDWFETKIQELF
jgi:cytochrome c biogenesis protein CcmG/thiol:disulfide interchange protein DsbE